MCKNGTLAIMRMKNSIRAYSRVISVRQHFTHLVDRADYCGVITHYLSTGTLVLPITPWCSSWDSIQS